MIEQANLKWHRSWWVLGVALVLTAEAAVCVFLFVPQSRVWAESKQRTATITR